MWHVLSDQVSSWFPFVDEIQISKEGFLISMTVFGHLQMITTIGEAEGERLSPAHEQTTFP